MARGLPEALLCAALTAAVFLLPGDSHSSPGDRELLDRIKILAGEGKAPQVRAAADEFLRRYPSSPFLPDALIMAGNMESNPNAAIERYRVAAGKSRSREKSAASRLNICRIMYLESRWNELLRESREAFRLHREDEYAPEFLLFVARACVFLESYENAERACEEITRRTRRYDYLSSALLLLSHINRKTTGYSRSYFTVIRDLVTGFPDSDIAPTALYLLGRSYHERGDWNRAYSAFIAVSRKYPKSPESVYSAERIASLTRHDPKTVSFIPSDAMLKSMDPIDLQAEGGNQETPAVDAGPFFSVSLGPVNAMADARRIAHLIKEEFAPVRIVNMGRNYAVYAGKLKDQRGAMTMKIRLAEELGLNGNIVRIVSESKKMYIYGD